MRFRFAVSAALFLAQGLCAQHIPVEFELKADVALPTTLAGAKRLSQKGACANRAISHDAHIWSVFVYLKYKTPAAYQPEGLDFGIFHAGGPELFIPVFSGSNIDSTFHSEGQKYDTRVRIRGSIVTLEFYGLSLSEAGDVVKLVSEPGSQARIAAAIASASPRLAVFRVTAAGTVAEKDFAKVRNDLLTAAIGDIDFQQAGDQVKQVLSARMVGAQVTELRAADQATRRTELNQQIEAIGKEIQAKSGDTAAVAKLSADLQKLVAELKELDAPDRKAELKKQIEALGKEVQAKSGDPAALSKLLSELQKINEELKGQSPAAEASLAPRYALVKDNEAVPLERLSITTADIGTMSKNLKQIAQYGNPGGDPGNKDIWIVDEPCLQVSLAPTLSGGETITAATFRFRYDWFSNPGEHFLKIRAEGDTASSGDFFQRLEVKIDGGWNFKKGSWLFTTGGTSSYSLSRQGSQTKEEWKAGGKAQLYGPSILGFLSALPGAGTKPVASLEFAAAGGDASSTRKTNFLGTGELGLTSRLNSRLSFDLSGFAGWSDQARFAGHREFGYIRIQGRYNVSKDWDYLVRYECGRKNPDYRKFCGWQSGLTMVLGR